jgi:hypothetical protein
MTTNVDVPQPAGRHPTARYSDAAFPPICLPPRSATHLMH